MYIIRSILTCPCPKWANFFGQHHTTVMHSVEKIRKDPGLQRRTERGHPGHQGQCQRPVLTHFAKCEPHDVKKPRRVDQTLCGHREPLAKVPCPHTSFLTDSTGLSTCGKLRCGQMGPLAEPLWTIIFLPHPLDAQSLAAQRLSLLFHFSAVPTSTTILIDSFLFHQSTDTPLTILQQRRGHLEVLL